MNDTSPVSVATSNRKHWPQTPPTWMIWCLILLSVILLYARALHAPFLLDDPVYIVQNPAIQSIDLLNPHLLWNSRALPFLTLQLNYAWSGLATWSYHLVNFLIHAANGILLFHLARRTLSLTLRRTTSQCTWLALTIAGLWVIHPLASQPVIYIIQRSELMASFAYLFGLYALTRASESSQSRWRWQSLAVISCIAGLYCKPIVATLPLAAVLWDRTFLTGSFKQSFKQRWKLHVALFASLSILFWTGIMGILVSAEPDATAHSAGFMVQSISPLHYLFVQSQVILLYLKLCVWPIELVFDYGWPPPRNLSPYFVSFGITTVLFLTSIFLLFSRFAKVGILLVLFFLILAPTSSFVPILDLAVEHRMYLPLACIVSLLVILTYTTLKAYPRVLICILILVSLFLAGRCYLRVGDYRSEVSLWRTVTQAVPLHPRAWYYIGSSLQEQNHLQQAMLAYQRTIEYSVQEPTNVNELAHIGLGEILLKQRQPAQAIPILEQANDMYQAADAHCLYLLGQAYAQTQNLVAAQQAYEQCITLEPDRIAYYLGLSEVLYYRKQTTSAIKILEQAMPRAVNQEDQLTLFQKLAQLYQLNRQFDQALEVLQKALASNPDDAGLNMQLAALHANQKQWPQARDIYAKLCAFPQATAAVRRAYAWLLATCPDPQVRNGKRALKLALTLAAQTPAQAIQKLDILAAAHAATGNTQQALTLINQAIESAKKEQQTALQKRLESRRLRYLAGKPYITE